MGSSLGCVERTRLLLACNLLLVVVGGRNKDIAIDSGGYSCVGICARLEQGRGSLYRKGHCNGDGNKAGGSWVEREGTKQHSLSPTAFIIRVRESASARGVSQAQIS